MKVKRAEPKPVFEPITIVIETEEEAYNLWHRLNVSLTGVYDSIHITPIQKEWIRNVTQDIWNLFDGYYRPKGEQK